jgi:carboxypeptidase Taq
MPEGANKGRSELISYISKLNHKKLTSDKTRKLIKKAENVNHLNLIDAAILREAKREYQKAIKIPLDLVEEIAKVSTLGHKAWEKARAKNEFSIFEPFLSKMIKLQKKYANLIDLYSNPYDNLLDDFEPGATEEWLTNLFNQLRPKLLEILETLMTSNDKPNQSILTKSYSPEKQWAFCREMIKELNFNFEIGRFDKSVHPFTISMGSSDVRITNRVMENFLPSCIFGAIHECGHALYEMGFMDEILSTNLENPCSMGIHESQSRLWENMVGRSKEFWEDYWYFKLQHFFPKNLEGCSAHEFYRTINTVKPSLIRVEADELTYSIHIILRFEIEKLIFAEEVETADLPQIWNEKMEELLGLTPDTNAKGILQDVHWSGGAFGYFPSYALGNLYAAQIYSTAAEKIPELSNHLSHGNYRPLLNYLRRNIHQYGKIYPPRELIKRVSGKKLNPKYFLDYLRDKFFPIYRIN